MNRAVCPNPASLPAPVVALALALTLPVWAWQVVDYQRVPSGIGPLATADGVLWFAFSTEADSALWVYAVDSQAVVAELPAPERVCYGLSYAGGDYWFMGRESILRLNAEAEVVGRINQPYEVMTTLEAVGDGFWTMARLGGAVYLANFRANGEEIRRYRLNLSNPGDLAWDGTYLWVTSTDEGLVYQVNPANGAVVEMYPTPASGPRGITAYDGVLFLIDRGDAAADYLLYRINPAAQDAPRLLASADYHDFGTVVVNVPQQWYLSLFNIGSAALHVYSARLVGQNSGFIGGAVPPNGWTVQPGGAVQTRIVFSPDHYGIHRDTMLVRSDDPVREETRVALAGLGVYSVGVLDLFPRTVDFGVVRADPWRDGSRVRRLNLVNQGLGAVRIDSLLVGIEEIFGVASPALPFTVPTAETIGVSLWFTPHRGIRYLDTLVVISSGAGQYAHFVPLVGWGSDSVYAGGTALWRFQLGGEDGRFGAAIPISDLTGDRIAEAAAVGSDGVLVCLNGFSADTADVIWRQDFAGYPRLAQVPHAGGLAHAGDLDGDGQADLFAASGGNPAEMFAVSGRGEVLWLWSGGGVTGDLVGLACDWDLNGDGVADPVALFYDPASATGLALQISGADGTTTWMRRLPQCRQILTLPDQDGDGVEDFLLTGPQGDLITLSGYSGHLMRILRPGNFGGYLQALPYFFPDGATAVVLAPEVGGMVSVNLSRGNVDWFFDFGLQGPGERYGAVQALARTDGRLAFGTDRGFFGVLDLSAPESPVWAVSLDAAVTAVTFLDDLSGDGVPEAAAGTALGDVYGYDGAQGRDIWTYDETRLDPGAVVHLSVLDDVDLGGTRDLLVYTEAGTVICVSSAGDVAGAGVEESPALKPPMRMSLSPNPFNLEVSADLTLPRGGTYTLGVYDLVGREVERRTFTASAGFRRITLHTAPWAGLPAGVYVFALKGDGRTVVQKAVLCK